MSWWIGWILSAWEQQVLEGLSKKLMLIPASHPAPRRRSIPEVDPEKTLRKARHLPYVHAKHCRISKPLAIVHRASLIST